MRERKWRAWGRALEVMYYFEAEGGVSLTLDDLAENDIWHVMDYTGLQDADGKDIYEDDIVFAHKNGARYIVRFGAYEDGHQAVRHYGFYLERQFDSVEYEEDIENGALDKIRSEPMGYPSENLRVIGDIHRDPELLTGLF